MGKNHTLSGARPGPFERAMAALPDVLIGAVFPVALAVPADVRPARDAWWPLLAFGWLLLSKFAGVFGREADNAERLARMKSLWGIGALAYLGGVSATVMLPLPRLGITQKALASFDMPVTGIWAEQPQTLAGLRAAVFRHAGAGQVARLNLAQGRAGPSGLRAAAVVP